ncbi:cellulose synthase/poly-beta-1,6-N-acetylglucosamine synthase-like glycosyltransferase [Herbihabitans rhizosphaerae]|uniref:Cellulose synthase/poly-beta-1,6-N-acetylglucosamine synthase-like glycosyltransferase n=1 Tax=Herbihabitans rhizosphaerae TaxID=1872711 RepID=A0A4Q7KEG1_9PSEU|nr:glycosyltransferase [Herbihabitans rhizosphaerae]RZS32634.1 cellulose synthase/poly-beta-1,6-N-acetylglucosamine synthase-like glycosyltransferase [Herbihabitans rhizosphaerae]
MPTADPGIDPRTVRVPRHSGAGRWYPGRRRWADRETWAREATDLLTAGERSRRTPVVAVIRFAERDRVTARFGAAGLAAVHDRVAAQLSADLARHELIGLDDGDGIIVLLRGTADRQVSRRLGALIARIGRTPIELDGDTIQITPICGWTTATRGTAALELLRRAAEASDIAGNHLDLIPRRWRPERQDDSEPKLPKSLRTAVQIALTVLLGVCLPFAALVGLQQVGVDLGTPVYLLVTVSLVVTTALIWAEGLHALDPARLPAAPSHYPRASAVIAAYLPNEADTIVDTIRAFQAQDYPGPLQIVLAYNTPRDLPVEDTLRAMAAADRRLVLLRVDGSTSKAQNVNAALQVVDGEFTGLFDADHQPSVDAYRRAWHWLADGADVVQGHCVIRNGGDSWIARTVAVEFECIYAVSHSGRAQLHQFGLFGGSNGFWSTSVLRDVRMHGHMLTEDIDSSFRALLSGHRLVYDPLLLSRELAPVTLRALWNQRMRWAQGWSQVSRRHLAAALRSDRLSRRNKFGTAFLLGWREVYPWLSLQMFPVIAYLAWRAGGPQNLDWAIPTFVLTSLYTLSAGPVMVLFAWRLAAPEVREKRWWFAAYLVVSTLLYTELKNLVSRVAHLKELAGERRWVVTPRQGPS